MATLHSQTQWVSRFGAFLFAATLGVASVDVALAFPLAKAPPFTGTYKVTGKDKKDTVTIAVLGNKSSWKDGDGQITINDIQSKKVIVYGGKSKEKVAQQTALAETTSNWEFGYVTLATSMNTPPKEGVKGKYGGEACTVVQFDTKNFGKPELCITDKGIVTRYVDRAADGSETIYEAQKIDTSAPSRDLFEVPSGFDLKE